MSTNADERRALVDSLAAQLRARVLDGALPPGTRLRQEALAEEFGVSRTPIREALRQLQASGLVELQHHRGALVRGFSSREIRDAYEVRAELEGFAANLAAQRIRQQELDQLEEAQQRFTDALNRTLAARRDGGAEPMGDDVIRDWGRANDTFHQVIQNATGNQALLATLASLHRSFPRDLSRIVLGESTVLLEQNVREHRAILDAIREGNAHAARELMIQHVRRAGELVTRRVELRADQAAR